MKFENVIEAQKYALEVVEDLKHNGIRIEIKPARSDNEEFYAKLQKKYAPPERLPHQLWKHITFYPEGEEQRKKIYQSRKELGWLGLSFDTGGCADCFDWELDWSFKLRDEPASGEEEKMNEMVEDMVNKMARGEKI